MGFEFKQTFVPVEINGKEYQVRVGDLDAIDETKKVVARIQKLANNNNLDDTAKMTSIFREMRNLIAGMIGQEACDEIFKGRGNNFMETLQLLTYLKKTAADAQKETSMQELFKEFGV